MAAADSDGGEPVRGEPQPDGRDDGERPREDQGASRRHLAGDERPVHGALHVRVDVAVEVHVERRGRPGAHRAADDGGEHEPEVREAALGEDHDRHGRDEQQLEDARLRQRDVGADGAAEGAPGIARFADGYASAGRRRDVHRPRNRRLQNSPQSMASHTRVPARATPHNRPRIGVSRTSPRRRDAETDCGSPCGRLCHTASLIAGTACRLGMLKPRAPRADFPLLHPDKGCGTATSGRNL